MSNCEMKSCEKCTSVNFYGESKAKKCKIHSDSRMINVISKRCRCDKAQPIFNFEGILPAICCRDCKDPGMIDVKNKRCRCDKALPSFNFEGILPAI